MKLIRKFDCVAKTQSHSMTRNITCFAICSLNFLADFPFFKTWQSTKMWIIGGEDGRY